MTKIVLKSDLQELQLDIYCNLGHQSFCKNNISVLLYHFLVGHIHFRMQCLRQNNIQTFIFTSEPLQYH